MILFNYFCSRFLNDFYGTIYRGRKRLCGVLKKRFGKGVVEYGLIEEGDRILIGLSGGKDSLALVELLARRSRILKPRFSVIAVHVVMKNIPYQSDVDYLRNYTESCGIPFVLYETEFDASTDTRKSPCFYVLGIGGKLCLLWQRSNSATR